MLILCAVEVKFVHPPLWCHLFNSAAPIVTTCKCHYKVLAAWMPDAGCRMGAKNHGTVDALGFRLHFRCLGLQTKSQLDWTLVVLGLPTCRERSPGPFQRCGPYQRCGQEYSLILQLP